MTGEARVWRVAKPQSRGVRANHAQDGRDQFPKLTRGRVRQKGMRHACRSTVASGHVHSNLRSHVLNVQKREITHLIKDLELAHLRGGKTK